MDNARTVVSNALGESQVRWRGSLPLTVLALQSSVGNLGASSQLQKYIEEVAGEADAIIGNKIEEKDIWGSLRRCLAAIAEVQTYVLASSKEADASLKRAIKLRYGFAGFKVPACLNIGEAILICQPGGSDEMGKEITDTVLSAAHNIQDPVFCARSTARADAMIGQLWKTTGPGTSLAQIIANFVKDPFAPDFATLHRIGGGKKYPKRDDSNSKYPLPEVMKTDKGITLSKLAAEVYHCPIFELRRLNPKYQPDILLSSDKPMFIRIPDAGFAPWLAARFAAEALVLPDVRDEERVWLIKGLVPIAAPDPTALDTVLARLLLTTYPLLKAHPERDGLISALAAAAGGLHRPMGHVLPQGIILP
jgi:hypothetical protein